METEGRESPGGGERSISTSGSGEPGRGGALGSRPETLGQSGAERAALGLEDWFGRPGRDPSKIGGTLLHPSCSRAPREAAGNGLTWSCTAEDRPPVPGEPSGEGSRAAGTAKR